jgi:hypothetical protein
MRRDMDLIRDLMLKLETLPMPAGAICALSAYKDLSIPGRSTDEINAHMFMIADVGYVIGAPDGTRRMMNGDWMFSRLSPEGHDFVDAVREPSVWSRTKAAVEKIGGWTLPIVAEIAKGYLKERAKDVLGLDL